MYQKISFQDQPHLSQADTQKCSAVLKLLQAAEADKISTLDFSQSFNIDDFQLGDLIFQNFSSDGSEDSVQDGQKNKNNQDLYLVCQGRVRLLTVDLEYQQGVSVQVLEEGETFGLDGWFCETPLSYRAIAASPGQIAQISASKLQPWLEQYPSLQTFLQHQASQRERLIFFKTYTHLGARSTSKKEALTSNQLQQLLPYFEAIKVSAGENLATHLATSEGYFWLRSGDIQSQDAEPPSIGSHWGYPTKTPPDWIAQTDAVVYTLPNQYWEQVRAIAPHLFPGNSATTAVSSSIPPKRSSRSTRSELQPSHLAPSQDESDTPAPNKRRSQTISIAFPKPQKTPRFRKFWHGYPFIHQQSSSDCGVACIAMIGQYWGKRLNLNSLRNAAKVGRSGASLKNLATAAEAVGFQAQPVRASFSRLVEQKQPWIAHWQGDHYVVVYRVRGNRVIVADPARGKRAISHQEFSTHWTGYALLLNPTLHLKQADSEQRSLKPFWSAFWAYRSTLWQIILISLLIQVFGLVTPLFTQIILDRVVTQKSFATLNVFAIGLVLFSVWRVGLATVRQYLLDFFSNRLDVTLISGFISHTLLLPITFFESRQVGDIITRVQENQKIQRFLVRQAVSTWLDSLMAIVYLGLMLYYNWRLTLFVVGLIPPIVLLTLGATPFLRRISREIFSEASEQNSLLVEMLTGIDTVKASAAEREVRWRWEDRLTSTVNVQFRGQKLVNGLQGMGGLINSIGSAALLWYGATLVIQGQLTIGQFVAFNMLIGNVIAPVLALVGLWDEFQEVLIAVERLNDVFATAPEETSHRPMLVLPPIRGMVQVDNVTFHYDQAEEQNALQNISFSVQPGETIAIVGRSGSGKSTLVRLLQGLYQPSHGRIVIDGHDIRHVSPSSLRSQLGVVPQECFLFSGTILENIQLYRSEFSLEQVIEIAKLAEANTFIQELPLGYNTKVSERGCNLSGGQRQRIAIARALLGDPAILILDEATSSLDTEAERRFQRNLEHISHGRTTFIIAHRLSTVRYADRILVLDRGVLVEQGTHDELVALQGLYYHLAQQQLHL
jgi:ATP-binding cassette subfamily B protein